MLPHRSRKERLDYAAEGLWRISILLFEAMGYRRIEVVDFDSKGTLVPEVTFGHRDPEHQIRPDVNAVEEFLEKNFRLVPFDVRIDSRAKRFHLKKSVTRPSKHRPPPRSIIT